jgi:dihydroorotase-like cyclic amidohydrolase
MVDGGDDAIVGDRSRVDTAIGHPAVRPVGRIDLALVDGRVIDPETGLDAVTDVGVSGAKITHVGGPLPAAQRTIDCAGLVVAPGFIDLHSHAQTLSGARLQALDGVTTAVDLECGALSVRAWYALMASEGRPINYGYSASWAAARAQAVGHMPRAPGTYPTGFDGFRALTRSSSWCRSIDESESRRVLGLLEQELEEGALGIGTLLGYLPEASVPEVSGIASLAARSGTAAFVHSRSSARYGPTTALDAVRELIDAAEQTAAHVHLCHVNSTSSSWMNQIVDAIDAAQLRGVRITTEAYPYERGSTVIGAAFLTPDELRREGRDPGSLIYAPTGETITDEARLEELRARDPGGIVMTLTQDLADPEEAALLDRALMIPGAAFASDAMPATTHALPGDRWPLPTDVLVHPRSAGCFARVFATLVRERGLLSIPEAVRRCTLVPAEILAGTAPTMRSKGRIQVGADADIVTFDADKFSDRATYSRLETSTGIRLLLVAGSAVVDDGELHLGVLPGRAIAGVRE